MTFEEYTHVSFTCINENIDTITSAVHQILTKKNNIWEVKKQDLDLKLLYFPYPPKGLMYDSKFFLWEPKNCIGTTIFMSNYLDGWHSLMTILAKNFQTEQVEIHLSNNIDIEPMFSFHYRKGNTERIIRSMIDGKWQFYQKGEKLLFENESYYTRSKIKDRMNYDIICEYLWAMGWDIKSNLFYLSNHSAVYFENITPFGLNL